MSPPLPWLLLGNPANRRVTGFQAALAEAGLPAAEVVPWLSVLRDFTALERIDAGPRLVRLDALGEDFEVERLLLHRGGFPGALAYPERRGEVVAPAVAHRGFTALLGELGALLAARPAWRPLNLPAEVEELFDKRRTARRFRAAGLPVPDFLEEVPAEPGVLLEALRARGWTQAFVKPAMGSSASGVLLLTLEAGGGAHLLTSLEWDEPRWFNSLRLCRYRTPEAVARALAFVLAQGAQVERAVPKAKLAGSPFDLRVLCIAGEPRFTVVRQSRHPITNLHLGGWRGDLAALQAAMPPGAWEGLLDTCRRAAGLYRSLHLGLDVLLEPDLRRHCLLEANAFGDLLPNLTLQGRDVYGWEVAEALKPTGMRSSSPSP